MNNIDNIFGSLGVIIVAIYFGFLLKRDPLLKKKVVGEHQRAVRTRNGKVVTVLGPGVYWLRNSEALDFVDIRERTEVVVGQEILTSDGLPVKTSLYVNFKVSDPKKAIYNSQNYGVSLHFMLQNCIREIIGTVTLEELLSKKNELNIQLQEKSEKIGQDLGLTITHAAMRDIMLSGELKRALSKVATAKHEAVAKLERARGETAVLRHLANSAKMLEENPNLFQLRLLDAISQGTGNTIVLGQAGTPVIPPKSK